MNPPKKIVSRNQARSCSKAARRFTVHRMSHLISCWSRCAGLCAIMAISHAVHAEEQRLSSPARDAVEELALVVRRARQARAAGRFAEAQAVLEEALSSDNGASMTAALRTQL